MRNSMTGFVQLGPYALLKIIHRSNTRSPYSTPLFFFAASMNILYNLFIIFTLYFLSS